MKSSEIELFVQHINDSSTVVNALHSALKSAVQERNALRSQVAQLQYELAEDDGSKAQANKAINDANAPAEPSSIDADVEALLATAGELLAALQPGKSFDSSSASAEPSTESKIDGTDANAVDDGTGASTAVSAEGNAPSKPTGGTASPVEASSKSPTSEPAHEEHAKRGPGRPPKAKSE